MKTYGHKNPYMNIYNSLIIFTKTEKKSKCPLSDKWTMKLWYIHILEYHSVVNSSRILIQQQEWKLNSLQKVKETIHVVIYSMASFIWHLALVTQLCLTLCDPMACLLPTRLLSPCDFPGKNTIVGCHFLERKCYKDRMISVREKIWLWMSYTREFGIWVMELFLSLIVVVRT